MYHDIGGKFIAVTDHNFVTDLEEIKLLYPDMIFFQGFEHSKGEDLLFIGNKVQPLHELPLNEALARADNLLTIICHPQPRKNEEYWFYEKILSLTHLPDGIEIFNGHYGTARMVANGCIPLYTHIWDCLLTKGHCLWGFANDDFHDPEDFNNAFNMVFVEKLTPVAVLQAAREGCFYASSGLTLESITENCGHITVTVGSSCIGRFIGPGGKTLLETEGRCFNYTVRDEAYVRFEAEGNPGRLFLQPMFCQSI